MRSFYAATLTAFLFTSLIASTAHAERQHQTRRFSLIAGANDGGGDRVRLRYAGSDAASMAKVLSELGGVAAGDQLLLLDPDRAALQHGLAAMTERLQAARAEGDRVELFFYYSGHSDEEGLLLGNERFGYGELRQAIDELPAEVRVAILDSCASGALTRRKGGVLRPPFLLDASSSVKGHAFLTASSADEAAQESDRIGASFFTHHLVSGLRGAADTSGTGRVTLNEAYAYAFRETLSNTERTQHGAQHPAYEMQLVGSGDLVITDLRSASAGLILGEELGGRIFLRDRDGNLVVEVRKQAGAPLELGLSPGDYAITLDEKGALFAATLQLEDGTRSHLGRSELLPATRERTVRRGDTLSEQDPATTDLEVAAWEDGEADPTVTADTEALATAEEDYEVVPFSSSIFPEPPRGRPTTSKFSLNLLGGRATRLDGVQISLGLNMIDETVHGSQIAIGGNIAGGSVDGVQIATGVNMAGGYLEGAQIATALNLADGAVNGAQIAAGFNHASGSFEGAQISSGANVAGGDFNGFQAATGFSGTGGDFLGSQLSIGASYTRGEFEGFQSAIGASVAGGSVLGSQLSIGASYAGGDLEGMQAAIGAAVTAGSVDGAQLAVGASIAGGDLEGMQAAVGSSVTAGRLEGFQTSVGLSYARAIDGLQLSLINVSGSVDGSQIGIVNVAGRNRGMQLGLLNFASESDVSIGLLSFVRNGRFDLELSSSDVNVANLGFQLGTRYVYGIVTAGLSPRQGDAPIRWSNGMGIGTRIGFEQAFLDFLNIDLTVNSVRDGATWESENLLHVLRLGAGWQLAPQLAITVGPSLNVFTGFGSDRDDLELIPGWVIDGKNPVRIWPGFFAAVQI